MPFLARKIAFNKLCISTVTVDKQNERLAVQLISQFFLNIYFKANEGINLLNFRRKTICFYL